MGKRLDAFGQAVIDRIVQFIVVSTFVVYFGYGITTAFVLNIVWFVSSNVIAPITVQALQEPSYTDSEVLVGVPPQVRFYCD